MQVICIQNYSYDALNVQHNGDYVQRDRNKKRGEIINYGKSIIILIDICVDEIIYWLISIEEILLAIRNIVRNK